MKKKVIQVTGTLEVKIFSAKLLYNKKNDGVIKVQEYEQLPYSKLTKSLYCTKKPYRVREIFKPFYVNTTKTSR